MNQSKKTHLLVVDPQVPELFQKFELSFTQVSHGEFQQAHVAPEQLEAVRPIQNMLNISGKTCLLYPQKDIKAVFFDMDSTVIKQETIVELAKFVGTESEVEKITEEAMAGELDFKEALYKRVATLKGLETSNYDQVFKRLTIQEGMSDFALLAKKNGLKLFLISGGFIPFAQRLAEELGFDGFHANQLEVDHENKLTGKVIGEIVDAEAKKHYVINTCRKLGIDLEQTLVVGDGANDLEMMSVAGIKIGFEPKPVVIEACDGSMFSSHQALKFVITS